MIYSYAVSFKSVRTLMLCVVFITASARAGAQNASEKLRDPFWPIGYVPADWAKPVEKEADDHSGPESKVSSAEDAGWDAALAKVQIAGISRKGDVVVVIINDRVKQLGSTVSVEHDGNRYTWRIESVDKKGSLKLTRVSMQQATGR